MVLLLLALRLWHGASRKRIPHHLHGNLSTLRGVAVSSLPPARSREIPMPSCRARPCHKESQPTEPTDEVSSPQSNALRRDPLPQAHTKMIRNSPFFTLQLAQRGHDTEESMRNLNRKRLHEAEPSDNNLPPGTSDDTGFAMSTMTPILPWTYPRGFSTGCCNRESLSPLTVGYPSRIR